MSAKCHKQLFKDGVCVSFLASQTGLSAAVDARSATASLILKGWSWV
jgi:hypothetical protein